MKQKLLKIIEHPALMVIWPILGMAISFPFCWSFFLCLGIGFGLLFIHLLVWLYFDDKAGFLKNVWEIFGGAITGIIVSVVILGLYVIHRLITCQP